MTVLIIRPEQAANELVQLLQQQSIGAIAFPLIGFEMAPSLSESDYHTLADADQVIAVSKPASLYADRWLNSLGKSWPKTHYLAVGRSSAYCLKQCSGQQVTFPQIEDSEHLLQLQPLQQVEGQQIVILRGQSGREHLYQTLTQRGAKVSYIETYHRSTLAWDCDSQFKKWQQLGVNKIVVTSAEQLNLLIKKANLDQLAWLQSQQLFVTSARISRLASQLGFAHITITHKADNPTLAEHIAR